MTMEFQPFKAHNKLRCFVVDQQRNWIYSVGDDDHLILIFDLNNKCQLADSFKPANCTVISMTLDCYSQRLYCATREGMLLFFNISDIIPILVHSMRLIMPQSLGSNYIKTIEFDIDKNILLLRMKSHSIIIIQLVRNLVEKSTIIEKVAYSAEENPGDCIT